MGQDRTDTTLAIFYRAERVGAVRLVDGRGQLGEGAIPASGRQLSHGVVGASLASTGSC
jgi:hypothetical protein